MMGILRSIKTTSGRAVTRRGDDLELRITAQDRVQAFTYNVLIIANQNLDHTLARLIESRLFPVQIGF
jgi:hypothetical protein